MEVKFLKTQNAQKIGKYKPTLIDIQKSESDFRIIQVSPLYIKWKDGACERVTKRRLQSLQKNHTWAVDF